MRIKPASRKQLRTTQGSNVVKKVLRGTFAASVAFAACLGFGASASAAEAPLTTADGHEINILNNACILPWFWQGPVNLLIGHQDGSYTACNMAEDVEESATSASGGEINIGNNACILPWFWQGPFNILVGHQEGSYEACNGADEIIDDVESVQVLQNADLPDELKDQILAQLNAAKR
jgi:type III secretory pathway component EscT